MPDYLCFNHEHPLYCIVDKREFKKNIWGKVNRLEITCHCPKCDMRLTYSIKVKGVVQWQQ